LSDKVAIITGATSGIGAATALLFAQEGARLVITGRRADLGGALRERCQEAGAHCVFVGADHTRKDDCDRVVDRALEEFQQIDVLFNNAGVVTTGTADTTTEDVWRSTMDINLHAVWRMCAIVIPHMRARGAGSIVNNGSFWSVVGGTNALPYVASKGAVALMTKAMALDHARDGIRVNAVCPGGTFVDRWADRFRAMPDSESAVRDASSHIPMRRFASPEEIARVALFLASDESSYVTGHLLLADGGLTAQ
jgi:NAD(P)-dependent dehydrogenase (short-subunit alcohol dehydrogenase family)